MRASGTIVPMTDKLKRRGHVFLGVTIIVVSILFVLWYLTLQKSAEIAIAGNIFKVKVADTDAARIRGLSGTSELSSDEAMLFIFDYDSEWAIWMKDMNYAIDIVWLDKNRHIIDFTQNATPESYPKRFMPKQEARYVVEFKSGTIEARGFRIGQQVNFKRVEKES